MTDIVERLRASVTKGHEPTDEDAIEAADEIDRLRADCDRLREFNTRLCTEIDPLRDMVRDVMSELLIAQEDNQMSSSAYRGKWLGELIALCQRGLKNREASR